MFTLHSLNEFRCSKEIVPLKTSPYEMISFCLEAPAPDLYTAGEMHNSEQILEKQSKKSRKW